MSDYPITKSWDSFLMDIQRAKNTGNHALLTTSAFRLAVATMDANGVADHMLKEMGIRATVKEDAQGNLMIGFGRFCHHSHATILRALQGAFPTVGAMTEGGSQAIRVLRGEAS